MAWQGLGEVAEQGGRAAAGLEAGQARQGEHSKAREARQAKQARKMVDSKREGSVELRTRGFHFCK